jgi:hypothetical protein
MASLGWAIRTLVVVVALSTVAGDGTVGANAAWASAAWASDCACLGPAHRWPGNYSTCGVGATCAEAESDLYGYLDTTISGFCTDGVCWQDYVITYDCHPVQEHVAVCGYTNYKCAVCF